MYFFSFLDPDFAWSDPECVVKSRASSVPFPDRGSGPLGRVNTSTHPALSEKFNRMMRQFIKHGYADARTIERFSNDRSNLFQDVCDKKGNVGEVQLQECRFVTRKNQDANVYRFKTRKMLLKET